MYRGKTLLQVQRYFECLDSVCGTNPLNSEFYLFRLIFRPLILPDYAKLELHIAENARSGALVTFDGKFPLELLPGDSLHVELSPSPVPTIDFMDQTVDWFASVNRCFGWNDRLEQLGMKATEIKAATSASFRLPQRDGVTSSATSSESSCSDTEVLYSCRDQGSFSSQESNDGNETNNDCSMSAEITERSEKPSYISVRSPVDAKGMT